MLILRVILIIIFLLSAFCIVWSMAGYDISLKLINNMKKKEAVRYTDYKYSVTVMIVAHNEEAVIQQKLENVIENDYPKEKIKYLIASDNSYDNTNLIVERFIKEHKDLSIKLYTSKEHKGKTNAQNEAQELVDTDILIMTDANSMFEKNAITELVSSFAEDDITYVCGALLYTNTENATADSESSYWNKELQTRRIESNIKTITAGNGAIYACRNNAYIKILPIECHDSSMPYYYGMHGQRAIFNEKAVAYEKAGENTEDEFKRKVRMNRVILMHIKNGIKAMNIFKYGWFSYFYFGHRTARYLLWLNHLLVLISNLALSVITNGVFWKVILALQVLFYATGLIGKYAKSKILHMVYYYCITVLAQWNGVVNCITGKAKPTWDKAESTR
ncbi:glycosyltransferase [Anaerocolumna aminovalerica]|uniref:glycosyltransferase n=1 Tax=Anaerocolumna aminovalerica TaxID=1527 RepID=UPI00248BB1D4|nr:glycosyltransferase [Anaerocolumna aminovalerica]